MSDAWIRIVPDDASEVDRLGALTVSQFRADHVERLREQASALIDRMLDEAEVTEPTARKSVHAKLRERLEEHLAGELGALIDLECERLTLAASAQSMAH